MLLIIGGRGILPSIFASHQSEPWDGEEKGLNVVMLEAGRPPSEALVLTDEGKEIMVV